MIRYGSNTRNKFGARKFRNEWGEWASKAEFWRFAELLEMQRKGLINGLQRQVKYVLIPAQREDKKLIERECSYYADFVYIRDGEQVVEDTKGVRTPEYIIKRKLMLYVHKIRIKEV